MHSSRRSLVFMALLPIWNHAAAHKTVRLPEFLNQRLACWTPINLRLRLRRSLWDVIDHHVCNSLAHIDSPVLNTTNNQKQSHACLLPNLVFTTRYCHTAAPQTHSHVPTCDS